MERANHGSMGLRTLGFVMLLIVFPLVVASATDLPPNDGDWTLTGNDTVRIDQYGRKGNDGAALFGNLGNHYYDELQLQGLCRVSEFDRWRFEFGGVANNSLYRSNGWGGELERIRLMREKGDGALPYRLELGDLYANFSYRTLMRSLKGIQLELQPRFNPQARNRDSFLLVLGQSDYDWKNLHENRDSTAGLSWLLQYREKMRAGINVVFNRRDPDAKLGTLEREQRTMSVMLENESTMFGRRSILEGEFAWFSGDHDGTDGPRSGLDRRATAAYGQLSGGDSRFTYRLRLESNQQDFRPAGANVGFDRKTMEGFFTWDLKAGRSAQFRLQRFLDGWETDNCRVTKVAGLGFQGPLDLPGKVFGNLDMFLEEFLDVRRTLDAHARSVNADVSKSFSDKLSGRLGFSCRFLDDNVNDAGDSRLDQITLGFDHSVRMFELPGRLGLGVENRLLDNGGERSHEWTPALTLNLQKGVHDFGLHYRVFRQDPVNPLLADVDTSDLGFRYRYHHGPDTFGVEYLRNHRDTSRNLWTRSTQITAFYQRDIDAILRTGRPARPVAAPSPASPSSEDPVIGLLTLGKPGSPYGEARSALAEKMGAVQAWGGFDLSDRPVFDEISSRQRLILARDGEKVERTVLAIDTGKVPAFVQDVFERIRRDLVQRLGSPANFREKGSFGPKLASDLREGAFLRVYDWTVGEGVLRLGIPRRLDGLIRIEIQFASEFPTEPEISWGLESFY